MNQESEVMEVGAAALALEPIKQGRVVAAQPAPQDRQLSVIEHAARSGATPAEMRELMALQVQMDNHQIELMREKRRMDEEDRTRAALLAYRRDFAAFRGENIIVAKDKHVDRGRAGSFMQAEYHSVAQKLSPALSKHGFGFRHDQRFGAQDRPTPENPQGRMGWVWVTCYLEHKDGHIEKLELEGPEGDQSANTPVQNMQLTASYLKRQSLLAITGTATGGEDDENSMRNRQDKAAQASDASPDETEALLDTGRAEAMKGMKPLNAWWATLSAKQRSTLSRDFGSMRKAAAQADSEAGHD
jgi:hypothetical protein